MRPGERQDEEQGRRQGKQTRDLAFALLPSALTPIVLVPAALVTLSLVFALAGCATPEPDDSSEPITVQPVADLIVPAGKSPITDVDPPPRPTRPMTRARLANGFVEGALIPREGSADDDAAYVAVFRGIPYAQPPIGDLRFRPPRAARRWQASLLARDFKPGCWRQAEPLTHSPAEHRLAQDEDCLYLNVWTTATTTEERRPVVVVLHGGDPTTGDAAHWIYDGGQLSRRGAIVVTFNYRLGVLGFLAHPALSAEAKRDSPKQKWSGDSGASGNYGLLDQIAALRWVKLNIAAFGGNPNAVTVLADKQGANHLRLLMVSPLADGLLHRAIAVGGAPLEPLHQLRTSSDQPSDHDASQMDEGPSLARSSNQPMLSAEEVGARFLTGFHTRSLDPLDTLRQAKVEELLTAGAAAEPFEANIDGWVLPRPVAEAYRAGAFARIPLVLGWSHDPPSLFPAAIDSETPNDVVGYRQWLSSEFGDFADDFFGVYGAATDTRARAAYLEITSDRARAWPLRTWARWSRQRDVPTYLFVVSRTVGGPGSTLQASETIYGLGNVELKSRPLRGGEDAGRASPIDLTLSNLLTRYWFNFARTGDPNRGSGNQERPLAEWPPYDASSERIMQFGDTTAVIDLRTHPHHSSYRLDVFDALYELKGFQE
jgi:carboxylesterase type B